MRYGIPLLVLSLVVGMVLGHTLLSQAQAPRPIEYKVVVGQYMGSAAIQGGLPGTLTEQGQAGWELIQALPIPGSFATSIVLIFKRQPAQ